MESLRLKERESLRLMERERNRNREKEKGTKKKKNVKKDGKNRKEEKSRGKDRKNRKKNGKHGKRKGDMVTSKQSLSSWLQAILDAAPRIILFLIICRLQCLSCVHAQHLAPRDPLVIVPDPFPPNYSPTKFSYALPSNDVPFDKKMRDESLALEAETNRDKSLTLEVMWNGEVVARNAHTGEVQWYFSSGPPLSSNSMNQSDMAEDGNNMDNKALDNVDNDKYLFCGDDWKLQPFEKRYGTEILPVSPHELVGNTPTVLDDVVVLGSTTTTAFLVDADSGSMINHFYLHNGMNNNISDEAVRLWSRNDKLKDANILFIFRKDYQLQSIGARSGKLLWNVSVGEVSLHYAQFDGVLRLLGAPGSPGTAIQMNPKMDQGKDSNRNRNRAISGFWRIPISGLENTLSTQQNLHPLPGPKPEAIVGPSGKQNIETLTPLPSSIHSIHNSGIVSLGTTQRTKPEKSKNFGTLLGRFALGSLVVGSLGCIFAKRSVFKKASQQDKNEMLGKYKMVLNTSDHDIAVASEVESAVVESFPKQEKSIVGGRNTMVVREIEMTVFESSSKQEKSIVGDRDTTVVSEVESTVVESSPKQEKSIVGDPDTTVVSEVKSAVVESSPKQEKSIVGDHDTTVVSEVESAEVESSPKQEKSTVGDHDTTVVSEVESAVVESSPKQEKSIVGDHDTTVVSEVVSAVAESSPKQEKSIVEDQDTTVVSEVESDVAESSPKQEESIVGHHNTKVASEVESAVVKSSPKTEKSMVEEDITSEAMLAMSKIWEKMFEDYGEGRRIGKLFMTNTVIGYGSHGTVVYEGYLESRHVAVKRLLLQFYEKALKEITNLMMSDEHPNIVRCYAMEHDVDFVYVALERCSFSLNDVINFHRIRAAHSSNTNIYFEEITDEEKKQLNQKVVGVENFELWDEMGYPLPTLIQLMSDIVAGLAHCHDLGIVHRDLKPHNVLITGSRILRAKIADMGISKRLDDNASSFQTHTTGLGSSGWQAPEQLLKQRQTRAVDLFSLGCVLFFCVSGGGHPFGSHYERDRNIIDGKFDFFLIKDLPEAKDLLSGLLDSDPLRRPSAKCALTHPMLWSLEKCLFFLRDASDRVELEDRYAYSYLLDDLEQTINNSIGGGPWNLKLDHIVLQNLGRHRRYNFYSVRDLLRVIRNKLNHFRELPTQVQACLGSPPDGFMKYFRQKFPNLLLEVYHVFMNHCRWEPMFQPYYIANEVN